MDQIRILVIDDENDLCEIIQETLSAQGYLVKTVLDGEAGLELCKNFNPHVILLDVMLKERSGLDVLQEILEMDNHVKVLMISGMLDLRTAKEAITIGAVDYISKPIDFEALDRYLKEILRDTII